MERKPEGPALEAFVVTYDSAAVLPACLEALRDEGVPALVVDNCSRDGSAELAERLGARVLRNARNEGYGRANNRGAAASRAGHLLILNPDLALDRGAVAGLLDAARLYPDAGMLAPRIVEPDGRLFFRYRSLLARSLVNPAGRLSIPQGDCCTPVLSGACFLIERRLFLDLGGFDPSIFLFYEDDDLCRRLSDSGRALIHVHGASARHLRGGSTAPAPGRIFRARWHLAWSRAYACRKYGLPDGALGTFALNAVKACGACLTFRRSLIERYAGSAAGALAALRGREAIDREGLR